MRMGIPNHDWKVDDINSNFDLCDTYPPLICVPTSTTKAMLFGSSKFRSGSRLPVLSYLHSNGVKDKFMLIFIYNEIFLLFLGINYTFITTIIGF